MSAPDISPEQIGAIRQIDLSKEDEQWKRRRGDMARQRLVVLLGDLFKTLPDLDRVWLDFNGVKNNPWSWAIRACETPEQVEALSKIPWETFQETCTLEEKKIRQVFGIVRQWGQTMGQPVHASEALFRLFPDNPVLGREEFSQAWPYLMGGTWMLDDGLREHLRIEKRSQALDAQLPTPSSPRSGPRF